MNEKQQRRVIGKPFAKGGDPRQNRSGRGHGFDEMRKLAKKIAAEIVINADGEKMTCLEAIVRSWAKSSDPQLQRAFIEYGFGKVPDKLETDALEPKQTLVLHFDHEREKVEREQRRLLGNGDCE
jgi:hypothetical protein